MPGLLGSQSVEARMRLTLHSSDSQVRVLPCAPYPTSGYTGCAIGPEFAPAPLLTGNTCFSETRVILGPLSRGSSVATCQARGSGCLVSKMD